MKTLFKRTVERIITWEAKLVLKRYKPKIVAVTGSVGKTSAKDAIYTVMASSFHVRKSEKSFNNEIGVPLTILGLPNAWNNPLMWVLNILEGLILIILPFKYPEWLVLEVGADRPGDIKKVSEWLKPDVAVLTRFGDVPVHVEYFPSVEDLVTEKGYLAQNLKPDGILILNHDDKRVMSFSDSIIAKKITYGMHEGADIIGSHERITYGLYESSDIELPKGQLFRASYGGTSIPVTIQGGLGKQHIYPYLSAIAVGISLGINLVKMGEALEYHETPRGRMRLLAGIKDTVIIDDSYNSSPVAAEEGLKTLEAIVVAPGARKIAMLGDMMELGEYSIEEHKKIGQAAAKVATLFVCVGIRMRGAADAALDAGLEEGKVLQFDTAQEAGLYVSEHLERGDVMLIKGSQSMRMERAVEELMLHREEKESLLVRQDGTWLSKR